MAGMLSRRTFTTRRYLSTRGTASSASTTHFGFHQVPIEEKETLVGQVFSRVAPSYDRMNDAMSLGIHRCWKDAFVQKMYPNCNTQLLDVAGGTGDITFRFLQLASKAPCIQLTRDVIEREPSDANLNSQVRSTFKATVMDINADMLQVGMKRASQELSPDLASRIDWQQGNAENLVSIPSASKDIYSIAFGIRNCTHIDAVLREAYRVLKPGGLFYCLEFSQVQQPLLSPLYDFWSFQVIPRLGQIISNDKASYQYFVESIRRFPNQEQFTNIIQAGGFKQVSYDNLFGGICSIHIGLKL